MKTIFGSELISQLTAGLERRGVGKDQAVTALNLLTEILGRLKGSEATASFSQRARQNFANHVPMEIRIAVIDEMNAILGSFDLIAPFEEEGGREVECGGLTEQTGRLPWDTDPEYMDLN